MSATAPTGSPDTAIEIDLRDSSSQSASETRSNRISSADVDKALRSAGQRIAPVWPLDRFVAVNPYFGLADRTFGDAAGLLSRSAGARTTMPIAYYLDALSNERISVEAVADSLAANDSTSSVDVEQFVARCGTLADSSNDTLVRLPTVARAATALTGTDWVHFATERISAWAASHFDRGQAAWRGGMPGQSAFAAWRDEASIDRTPEIMGLAGFRRSVRALPQNHVEAAAHAVSVLGVGPTELVDYLHTLLMQVGGWAAHAAQLGFDASLYNSQDHTISELGAVVLCWEMALLETLKDRAIETEWARERDSADWFGANSDEELIACLILQDALDSSEQQRIIAKLDSAADKRDVTTVRPEAQAVFCIDVRSEVLRRHIEAANANVETIGFAGFFGVAIDYVPIGHEKGAAQCPVLLTPAKTIRETASNSQELEDAIQSRRLAHHVERAWKSFKMGAISCFSFVGPVGLLYLPKLFTDSAGRTRPSRPASTEGLSATVSSHRVPTLSQPTVSHETIGMDLKTQISTAEAILRATSLNDRLAPIVLIVGHGASTVNNPYDSALHCGACGGNTGEANARVAALILNNPDVRAELVARGLNVPSDTWFVAGLHDTTTDQLTVYDRELIPAHLAAGLKDLEATFSVGGDAARVERAERFNLRTNSDINKAVIRRSTDWAQVRPEWGLAGCRAFIAAPRHRTYGVDLGSQSFLHSYEWRRDEGFGILELILTAPVVVASWISLQYYGSTVEPQLFGSGNKTLHNVVGRLGVLEGNGGDLRTGLPWQSIHDGEGLQHEPLRLNVIVEAPTAAINDILAKHEHVANLFDNSWLRLLTMNDDGVIASRYVGNRQWEAV